MKKGQLIWEDITKWIVILVFMVAAIILIYLNKEKMFELFEKAKMVLRFGF
tara:strand:+ start:103 stop:255 length:153 start_codon:yes stop_codon:yes gene_type:complete